MVQDFLKRAAFRELNHAGGWRLARTSVTLAGVIVLLTWIARERALDLTTTWHALLLGIVLSQLSFACYAGRFRAVMQIVGVALSPVQALELSARALFYHCLVPLSVGSDLTRFTLCRAAAPQRPARLVAGGIVLDHGIGTLALLLLVGASVWTLVPAVEVSWPLQSGVGLAGLLVAGAAARWGRPLWQRHPEWRSRLRDHWPLAGQALALSLLMQGILAAAVYTGAQVWKIDLSYTQILGVLACGALLQIIPFNCGGLHLGDVAGTGLYVALGLPLRDAILLGSLLVSYRLLMAMAGGLWDLTGIRAIARRDAA